MKLSIEVKDETIGMLLDDAGQHIRYWAEKADRKDTFVLYLWAQSEGNSPFKWHRVGVKRALETMARVCPRHLTKLLQGDYDGDTCDLFAQYGCFGKAVYG